MREISAGIIIYRRTKDGPKFLLLYHGNRYWNFPKGKIEDQGGKETPFKAALREVREETSLGERNLRVSKWFKVHDHFIYTRDKKKIFKIVIYYLAESNRKEVRISEEHSGYGWFLYKDALRLLIYGNLKNNLKKAYETIQGKSLSRYKKNPER